MNKIKTLTYKVIWFLVATIPLAAHAAGETPIGEGLGYFIQGMYGATGVAIATLITMIFGLVCMAGLLSWMVIAYIIGGMGIVFGAGGIVAGIKAFIS